VDIQKEKFGNHPMSYIDEMRTERHQASQQNAGPGVFVGWVCIIGGVAAAIPTAGVSLILVALGAFLIGGTRVTQGALQAIEEAEGKQAVDKAAAGGCMGLVAFVLVFVLVMALMMVAAGGGR
jgi:hypothetical protein